MQAEHIFTALGIWVSTNSRFIKTKASSCELSQIKLKSGLIKNIYEWSSKKDIIIKMFNKKTQFTPSTENFRFFQKQSNRNRQTNGFGDQHSNHTVFKSAEGNKISHWNEQKEHYKDLWNERINSLYRINTIKTT